MEAAFVSVLEVFFFQMCSYNSLELERSGSEELVIGIMLITQSLYCSVEIILYIFDK